MRLTGESKRLAMQARITYMADRIRFLRDHIVCLRACLAYPDQVEVYLREAEEELARYGNASLKIKP